MGLNDEKTTYERIKEVAFRYLLEKGYEATNMRKISDEVGIKASSIYFYFKSKKELFIEIYNDICQEKVDSIKQINGRTNGLTGKEQLYLILKNQVKTCLDNSAPFRFVLRYRMFPADELLKESAELYEIWNEEEYRALIPVLETCVDENSMCTDLDLGMLFNIYKGMENSLIYNMLLSGVAAREEMIEAQWEIFWNNCLNI